jgi:hypothetical protein
MEGAMSWRALGLFVFGVTTIVFAPLAFGQAEPSQGSQSSKASATTAEDFSKSSFEDLIRERDSLSQQINDSGTRLYWINDAIVKIDQKKQLVDQHKPTDQIDKEIANSLGSGNVGGVPPDQLPLRAQQEQASQDEKQKRRTAIDTELARRADLEQPKQLFKLQMSGVFAALVGIVIVGFFAVAFRDEQVRREIFAGQAGIQFVTLFSLVIAIILFGIIGVLEGKELAALLGGLSGYILGRSTPVGPKQPSPGPQLAPLAPAGAGPSPQPAPPAPAGPGPNAQPAPLVPSVPALDTQPAPPVVGG